MRAAQFFTRFLIRGLAVTLAVASFACSSKWDKTLPPSSQLGSPHGYQIARTAIHLHSPLSWDACDKNGLPSGANNPVNGTCFDELRNGLCQNRYDFAFLTDHPDNMTKYDFNPASYPDLYLYRSANGDQLLSYSGQANRANQMSCPGSSQHPVVIPGYEDGSGLMPIGMTAHNGSFPGSFTNYANYDPMTVGNLHSTSNALVVIPHPESRDDTAYIAPIAQNPTAANCFGYIASSPCNGLADAIEVYNLHANFDPKIRHNYLGLDYFDGIFDLLFYWIDPYSEQQPDLAFLSVFERAPVYAQKWDKLVYQAWNGGGRAVMGVAGNDSHENVLSYQARDGERLDAHRRLLRWFSNHLLVTDSTNPDQAKAAIEAGRGWMVFEALGSPVGMDFYANSKGTIIDMGSNGAAAPTPGTFVAGKTTIYVALPTLHSSSPTNSWPDTVTIRLIQITSTGEQVVATSVNAPLTYSVLQAAPYRAEISMTPRHLSSYMGYLRSKLLKELPWIITNPIYLNN